MNYRGAFNTVDFKHQINGSQTYITTGPLWINRNFTKVLVLLILLQTQLLTSLKKCYWLYYKFNYWLNYKSATDFITKMFLTLLQIQLLTSLQKCYWFHYNNVTDFITKVLLMSSQKCYWLYCKFNYWLHYKVLLISLQKCNWLNYKSVTDLITNLSTDSIYWLHY